MFRLYTTIYISFIMVATLLSSCSNSNQNAQSIQSAQTIKEYEVMTLKPENRIINTSYSATIKGKQDIDVYPKVTGAIVQINIKEGEKVHKGQNLFLIDPVPYEITLRTAVANVESAKAQFASAQLQYESKKELFSKNIISKHDLSMSENTLLASKANLAQAEAQKQIAQNNLANTVVKSPADGVIGMLPYKKGTLVSPNMGQSLTTVSDNTDMYIYFSMNENEILELIRRYNSTESAIKNMPAVSLILGDNSTYSEKGKIESISGIIDHNTGNVSVKAVFPNKNGLLRSGGNGKIVIPIERNNVIVIPTSSTFRVQDRVYIYKLKDGAARAEIVNVSNVDGDKEYIVEKGLHEGETIIVEGIGLLREGTPVKVKSIAVKDSTNTEKE